MFEFFKKKSQLEKLIHKDGIEFAAKRFAEIIAKKLTRRELAYQFILEELEAASMGNSAAKKFVAESGIERSKYKDALNNSHPEIDGPDGPQLLIINLAMDLRHKPELMVEFRCKVDEHIMKLFGFGKFFTGSSEKNVHGSHPSYSWIETLRIWADDIGLPELKWEVQTRNRDGGFWTGFPRDPKKIAQLEGLNIQDLGLTELPEAITNLTKLRKIWARGNNLTRIPEEIGKLINLEEITKIPESIGKLTRLRDLDLRANQLIFVPSSVRNLTSLEKLDLRDQPVNLDHINTPLSDEQMEAICSLGDVVRW